MLFWMPTHMHTESDSPTSALFRSHGPAPSTSVTLRFHDRCISAPAGTSIAAALLLNGVEAFRGTPVTSAPRAPYCMMGVCFDCLVEVDGVPGRQACLIPVREGMVVRRQQGASALSFSMEGDGHGC